MGSASVSKGEAERPPEPPREDDSAEAPAIEVRRARCPYCHDEIAAEDTKQGCSDCMGWSHAACWSEHGGCAACGVRAGGAAPVQARPRRRPPRATASAGDARWRGQRKLKTLDPTLALSALRACFTQRGATVHASTRWGFSFSAGRPARLRGRLWVEEHDEGRVVRWEIDRTGFEQALLWTLFVLGLPTIVFPVLVVLVLRHYPHAWVTRQVGDALSKAWARQQQQG